MMFRSVCIAGSVECVRPIVLHSIVCTRRTIFAPVMRGKNTSVVLRVREINRPEHYLKRNV